jgi:hypothetical protein
MSQEAVVLKTSSPKFQSIVASLLQLRTFFWESFRGSSLELSQEVLLKDDPSDFTPQGEPPEPLASLALEDLIFKHQAFRSHSSPFRSLAIGKYARPEARFKELPQPSFGSTAVTLSLAGK